MDAVEELADHDRGAGVNVRDILDDKRICICAGSGGVGKTTTSAAIAMGMAAQGLKVAVLTIDPAKRLANSLGTARARQRGAARRPRALRGARHRDEGRAVGDDAGREAHVRRPGRAPRPRRGDARPHPAEPHLPGDLQRDGGLAGVHGDGEAVRAAPGGALRPARARHAADAPRARLHRRAGAHVAVHRGALAAVLPQARTAWREGARALWGRAVLGASSASRASTCCRTCPSSSRASATWPRASASARSA